jgi:putative transposase
VVTPLELEHGTRKRVRWLRQAMVLEAIWCRPRIMIPDRSHRKYPYLLRHLKIDRANQVWCIDITCVPMLVDGQRVH